MTATETHIPTARDLFHPGERVCIRMTDLEVVRGTITNYVGRETPTRPRYVSITLDNGGAHYVRLQSQITRTA